MEHEELKRQVNERIEERTEGMVKLLGSLVDKETVIGNEGPGQEVVIDKFEKMSLEPDVWIPDVDDLREHEGFFETQPYQEVGYEDRPNVVATIKGEGDGPTLALSGHMDVVPVTDSEWDYDPFSMTQKGDRLYGRGTGDMKGGLTACIHAIDCLRDLGIELQGDIYLQSTLEEEDGGVGGILSVLMRGYLPDGAIIAEPKGVPNMGMASAGVRYFKLTVHGKSAHVGYGFEGINALDKAMRLYEALRELDAERKARIDYEPAYRKDPRMRGHETNLNIGMIEAAEWPAIIPGEVELTGRLGWPPGEEPEDVMAELEATIAGVTESDEWLSDHPPELEFFGLQADPHETDPNEELLQVAMRNAEWITGHEGVFYGGSGGNDTRYYKRYYDIPAMSLGPEPNNIHGANEYVTLPSLIETAQSIACTAIDYCGVAET
ncbi:ArgE/DapE family deacylase [Saliphagus sp. LR7]|uniref:ArgE/DapE family deacylase n=1 Tax=Saliphagus sp. LR7 TaxID=2282654 RepID=UPI000DF81BB6|nr:ArgE/DapE family deacylase [Saliphagus sp. LR7]